jgi:DNA-binding transcriptional ArsR family regulator
MSYASALEALADPTRRRILDLLRDGPRPVGDIAARLPVSRPAVSRHLRVMTEASLVRHQPRGTRHLYEVDPRGLAAVRAWLDAWWDEPLNRFAAHVEESSHDDV